MAKFEWKNTDLVPDKKIEVIVKNAPKGDKEKAAYILGLKDELTPDELSIVIELIRA